MAEESPNKRPYSSKVMIVLRLAAIPFVGLLALMVRTARGKAKFRAETERLAREHKAQESVIGRYLDSRDVADDDVPKEWVMADDPVSNDTTAR
jgi:hypothetical protein